MNAQWTGFGSAHRAGDGIRIDLADGRTFAIGRGDAVALQKGCGVTLWSVSRDCTTPPRPMGWVKWSGSHKMLILDIDNDPMCRPMIPATDLLAHYTRNDRAGVNVVLPPEKTAIVREAGVV